MPTEAKQATVAELKEDLSNSQAAIVADYRGLTVSDISAVRRELRGKGITYRVVKNRLAQDRRTASRPRRAQRAARRTQRRWRWAAPTRSHSPSVFLDAIRPFRRSSFAAAWSASTASTPTRSRAWPRCPPRDVLLASWPVASRRRWRPWHRSCRHRCATWATPWAGRATSEASRATRPDASDSDHRPNQLDHHDKENHQQWQQSPRTRFSRPSTA